jgi:hypothetical protein
VLAHSCSHSRFHSYTSKGVRIRSQAPLVVVVACLGHTSHPLCTTSSHDDGDQRAIHHCPAAHSATLCPMQVDLARGNRAAAKRQYERILGKALRGYGPSEHWAHAEYARLLHADGDSVSALKHLTMALDVASLGDVPVEPADVASYNFAIGQVLWERPDRKECAPCLLSSTSYFRHSTTPRPPTNCNADPSYCTHHETESWVSSAKTHIIGHALS